MPKYAIDATLIDFIAQWEGFSAQPYNDPANNATGGYGHLIHMGPLDGRVSEAIWRNLTETEGKRRLAADIANYSRVVDSVVTVPLTYNQWRALVSFTFNVGAGNLQTSQLLVVLNRGNYDEVPGQLMRWVYGSDGNQYPGLIRRRKAEGELWNTPDNIIVTGGDMTRGDPRIQYQRVFNVAPQNATKEQWQQILDSVYTSKQTIGGSYDDAGIGNLDSRTAVLWGIEESKRQSFLDFFRDNYPGVVVQFKSFLGVDPPPPPPSVTGKTRLGVNVVTGNGDYARRAIAAGCTAISIINNFQLASELAAQHKNVTVMARRYVRSMPSPNMGLFEGAESPDVVYLTPLNECDVICYGSPDEIARRAAWDKDMWGMMKAAGRKYAGGGFSMGTPDYAKQEICDAMRAFYKPVYDSGMAINYHLYSPTPNHPMDVWYELRWRFLFEKCGFNPSPSLAGIYSDETGLDEGGVGGFPAHGVSANEVGAWCRRFLDASQGNGYGNLLRAAVIFQSGNTTDWNGYNVDYAINEIGAAAQAPVTRHLDRPLAPAYGLSPAEIAWTRKIMAEYQE
mgnify:FL=1